MSTDTTPCVAAHVTTAGESNRAALHERGWRTLAQRAFAKYFSKDILSTVVTSFTLFGLMTLQGVFLARMLGPEMRGQYATVVFYSQTLMYVGLLGTHYAVTRWAARRKKDVPALWGMTLRLGLMTGFATMSVVAILAFFALPADKRSLAPLCVLAAFFLPLEHVRLLWLSIEQGCADFRRYNISRLAAGISFPMLLGVAWAGGAHTAGLAALLFAVAPIAGLIYQRYSRPQVTNLVACQNGPTVNRVLHRGRPYALSVLVSDLCDRIDIFLFLWFTSFTAQGYYAASVPAANLLLVIPIALALFAFNHGARRDRNTSTRSVLQTSATILAIQIGSAVVFALMLEPLMVLVYGEPFRGAVPLTLNLLPAYAIAGCGRIAEAYLQGRNKAILGVYSRLVGAVVMCVAVYLTFDRWAELSIPRGALLAYLVSSTMLLIAILIDVRDPATPLMPSDAEVIA